LITFAGIASTGFWLERAAAWRSTSASPGRSASGFVLDVDTGSRQRWFHVSDHSADVLAGCDPASGMLWVSTDYPGYAGSGSPT